MKKSIFLFFAAILCASSAWAGTYYYSGEGNNTNWSKKAMTVSTDGFYEYYQVSSKTTHQFKIGTSSDQYAYNYTYVQKGFNSTNVTNIGDYSTNNCYCWHGSTHYILVYKPKTAINTTDKPVICASTTLPDSRNHGFEQDNNGIKFYHGSDTEWKFNGQIAQTKNLNTITQLYLKEWFVQLYENWDGAKGNVKMQYNIHLAKNTPGNYTDIEKNWTDGQGTWSNYYSNPKYGNNSLDINLLEGLGSGKYTMSFKYYDKDLNITSPIHKLNWTIAVPDITSAECTSNGTGLGTEVAPFLVPEGDILTLTVKGTQKSNDANSELYAQFASNAYSSTLTHNITPTTTVQSITVKVKYYNSADKLSSSNEETLTIYYKAIQEETHNVTISYQCNGNKIENVDDEIVKVGVSTESPITAPTIAGYTFSSWALGAGVQSADATANPISITTKSGETDYTLVANYNEDLTTSWVLKGSFVDDFKTAYDFVKKSGESTGNVAYVSIDLEADKEYLFKVVEGETWYGNNNSDEQWWIKQTAEDWSFYSDAGDCHMKSGLAGTYTFKIDYSAAVPKVSVYFPEIYAIVGSFNEWNENANKLTFDGNIGTATINLEASATIYEFKVIDNAVHGGIVDKTITQTENDLAIIVGGGDNIKLTANANPKGNYIFTYDKSTKKLSVTYPTVYTITVEAENGTVEGAGTYVEGTSITLTATANEGYHFEKWSNGSTDNPLNIVVTEDVELQAIFAINTYTVTATTTEGGEVIGNGTYNHDETVTLTATPNFDYVFVNWTVGGEEVATANPYTFQATANVEVVANFLEVTATTAKSGKFSTGKYEYAEFATGNLQYKPSTNTWRFAKQQYQYVGKDNIYVGKEDYKGWIDLFGWSADDKFGVNPSNDNTNYQGEFVDWGTLFPEEGWSTLSKDQWNYLLNKRPNYPKLKQIAMIGETLGIMLFPDKWTLPADCEPTKQTHHDEEDGEDHSCDFVSYNYTLAQWAELENAGAIFLPAAGRRTGGWGNQTISPHMTGKAELDADGHYKHYADYYAYYWTSTKTDGKVNYLINCTLVDKVKDTYTVHAGHVDWAEEARYGQSVRLAKVTSTLIEIGGDNNSSVIEANKDNIVNVQVNRTFKANNGYYTLCLPFALDADKIGKAYELGTITEYEADGGINIKLTEVEHIEAGKPYLVLPSEDLTNPIFENVTIVNTTGETIEPASVAGVKVTFTGIINGKGEKTDGKTEYYVGDNGYLYNGTVDKLGLRAFFTITNGEGQAISNVRARVVAGENVETGVEDIITTDAPVKVIENGQLIIIRGGEKYNVQGVRL